MIQSSFCCLRQQMVAKNVGCKIIIHPKNDFAATFARGVCAYMQCMKMWKKIYP